MKIVADASVLIDHLRGSTQWEQMVDTFPDTSELYLPTIVIFELFSGESTRKERVVSNILDVVGRFEVVDINWNIARRAGELYRDHIRELEVPDYIIAATALELSATLATLNKKHFDRIPGLMLYPSPN